MMRGSIGFVYPVVCLLVISAYPLFADGCFIPEFAGSAETVDQRAIVVFDDGRETLIIQTAYDGEGGDFAWVIPVPQLLSATDIGTVSADVFDDLYALTEPVAYGRYGMGSHGLFGCSSGGGAPDQLRTVRVWETLQVDEYEIAVLSATESADLQQWLTDNGYGFPADHEAELEYYVNKTWFFIAARLSPEDEREGDEQPPNAGQPGFGSGEEEMRPLRLTFDTAEPVYPMRISAVSSTTEVEVLIYAIGRNRLEGANYNTAEIRLAGTWDGTDFPAYYAEQFRQSLRRAGQGSLIVEYSGQLPDHIGSQHSNTLGLAAGDHHITRMRTFLHSQDMQEDVVLTQAPEDTDFQVIVAQAPVHADRRLAEAGWLMGVAALLGLLSRRKNSLLRYLGIAAVIALMIV